LIARVDYHALLMCSISNEATLSVPFLDFHSISTFSIAHACTFRSPQALEEFRVNRQRSLIARRLCLVSRSYVFLFFHSPRRAFVNTTSSATKQTTGRYNFRINKSRAVRTDEYFRPAQASPKIRRPARGNLTRRMRATPSVM